VKKTTVVSASSSRIGFYFLEDGSDKQDSLLMQKQNENSEGDISPCRKFEKMTDVTDTILTSTPLYTLKKSTEQEIRFCVKHFLKLCGAYISCVPPFCNLTCITHNLKT